MQARQILDALVHENSVQLGDLLSTQDLNKVLVLLRIADYTERITALKVFLNKRREALIAKGLLPEYLAYALEAQRKILLSRPPENGLN